MKCTERKNQMASSFSSFQKESYTKRERLEELLKLQAEMVDLAFPKIPEEERASLRLWDVRDLLERENDAVGGKASAEVAAFRKGSAAVGQLIAAEISGNAGEEKAYNRLISKGFPGTIVRNIELSDGCRKTEIDMVAISSAGAFIIEVKNTRKSVFIDEAGDQYKLGRFTKFDSPLGSKMALREELLRNVLNDAGCPEVEVRSLVVFTDNRIEVENRCRDLKACFLPQLPYLLENRRQTSPVSEEKRAAAKTAIEAHALTGCYPMDYDIQGFKEEFAAAVAAIEEAQSAQKSPIGKLLGKLKSLMNLPAANTRLAAPSAA